MLGDTNHYIKAKTRDNMYFQTENNKNFVFENGNILQSSGFHITSNQIKAPDNESLSLTDYDGNGIFVEDGGNLGIGTDNPVAKVQVKDGDIFIEDINHGIIMKSPDGNCWRGTLNNSGALTFAQVDCDELVNVKEENSPGRNSGVMIFPNPSGNRVMVKHNPELCGAELEISNTNGNLIHKQQLNNNSNSVNLEDFSRGIYFFTVKSGNGQVIETKKVIKE
jgi:hypothetical protein